MLAPLAARLTTGGLSPDARPPMTVDGLRATKGGVGAHRPGPVCLEPYLLAGLARGQGLKVELCDRYQYSFKRFLSSVASVLHRGAGPSLACLAKDRDALLTFWLRSYESAA